MSFNPTQIDPLDLDDSKAIGVNIPFNHPSVFSSNYLTKDAIKNNLINFFLTNPGERYLNPIFGGGIKNFIFEQISNQTTEFLDNDIRNKMNLFFSNISIDSLEITQFRDENTLQIKLTYSIINTTITDNLELII